MKLLNLFCRKDFACHDVSWSWSIYWLECLYYSCVSPFQTPFLSILLAPAFQATSQRSSRLSSAVSYATDEVSQARCTNTQQPLETVSSASHSYPSAGNHRWFRRRRSSLENIATASQVWPKISGLSTEKLYADKYIFFLSLSSTTTGQYRRRRHLAGPARKVRASQPEGSRSTTVMMTTTMR